MLRPKDPEVRVRGLEAVAGAQLEELGEVVVRHDRDGCSGTWGGRIVAMGDCGMSPSSSSQRNSCCSRR
jgi:hypothetical protein